MAADAATPKAADAHVVPSAFELGEHPSYSGLVTRAISATIDVLIIDGVALIVAAAAALITSLLPGSQKLHGLEIAIAALVFVLWAVGYFAVFWSTTGQTPGSRVMHIRVTRPDGARLHWLRAAARVGTTILAALPLFAGFVPVLLTRRRRGLNDMLADTVVTQAETLVTHTVPASPPVSAGGRTHVARGRGDHEPRGPD